MNRQRIEIYYGLVVNGERIGRERVGLYDSEQEAREAAAAYTEPVVILRMHVRGENVIQAAELA
jgi:hypothetical protein